MFSPILNQQIYKNFHNFFLIFLDRIVLLRSKNVTITLYLFSPKSHFAATLKENKTQKI